MIFIILMILESACVVPLTILWIKAGKGKIDEDDMLSLSVGFLIVASIINWFAYAAYPPGLVFSPTSGFLEGDLNVTGLLAAILPPLFITVISYFLFLLIDKIRFEIFLAKERNKRDRT